MKKHIKKLTCYALAMFCLTTASSAQENAEQTNVIPSTASGIVFMKSSQPTLDDMQIIRDALFEAITNPRKLPIRYCLDGKEYTGIDTSFETTATRRILDANLTEYTYTAVVPGTGLVLTAECFSYKDFPVFEWTVWFENKGETDSPVISDFYGCDTLLPKDGDVTLYHNNGDYCSRDGLETTERNMQDGEVFEAASVNGRSCDHAWPYYRILCGSYGYNIAIGWPGNWRSHIENTAQGIRFTDKQEYTRFYLKPGEKVRSPRTVIMAFSGDSNRGINLWRRWYFAHVTPRSRGKMLEPKFCFLYGGGGEEFTLADEANQLAAINWFIAHGEKPDIWWIDAGWYPCKDEAGVKRWTITGKWMPDPEKFPNGLGPVGKLCDDNGIQLLLWFEPERVKLDSWPKDNPQEFVLKLRTPTDNAWLNSNGLLYLGNPDCRQWLTNTVKNVIRDSHVKIYRQDFNGDPFPLAWWLQNDIEENRQGITENLHIQGYLQFWDDLLLDVPDLWIDSCASGGRRNDIEAMRRAVALHPTDYGYGEHPVKQAFQKTWFEWTPYFRSIASSWDDEDGNYNQGKPAVHGYDNYAAHCAFAPVCTFGADAYSDDATFQTAGYYRHLMCQAQPYTLESDFYCHTPVRKSNEDWFCIQFHKEETGKGLIQAIRNTRCEQETLTIYPAAFEIDGNYRFTVPETGEEFTLSGEEILKNGLTVALPKRTGRFWFYEKLQTGFLRRSHYDTQEHSARLVRCTFRPQPI